jgi:hypothetical protein
MAIVLDPRNPRKAATDPAAGLARWLARPNAKGEGGMLEINGAAYEVLPLHDGAALAGYRLVRVGPTLYDVLFPTAADGSWFCDCPDATYHPERPGGCKHVAALRTALAILEGGAR